MQYSERGKDRGFRALWGNDFLPALLLNGTHVETGKRVITSNIDIAGSPKVLAASELRELAELRDGKYFQFRLCSDPGRSEPALGWVLSKDAENLMREQLRSDACGNAEQFRLLLETLAGR